MSVIARGGSLSLAVNNGVGGELSISPDCACEEDELASAGADASSVKTPGSLQSSLGTALDETDGGFVSDFAAGA